MTISGNLNDFFREDENLSRFTDKLTVFARFSDIIFPELVNLFIYSMHFFFFLFRAERGLSSKLRSQPCSRPRSFCCAANLRSPDSFFLFGALSWTRRTQAAFARPEATPVLGTTWNASSTRVTLLEFKGTTW